VKTLDLKKVQEQARHRVNTRPSLQIGMDLQTATGDRYRFRLGDKVRVHFSEVEYGHPPYFDGVITAFIGDSVQLSTISTFIGPVGGSVSTTISLSSPNLKGFDLLEHGSRQDAAIQIVRKMVRG